MHSERILRLLAKQMGKEASAEELLELQELLRRSSEYHFLLEVLQSLEGEKLHREPALSEEALVHEGWGLLQNELNGLQTGNTQTGKNKIVKDRAGFPWIGRAAVWGGVILLACSSFFVWKNSSEQKKLSAVAKISQVSVPFGMPERKLLPDSTVVWINAGSRIRYNENFVQKQREVYLEGEAFFSVRHDAAHPFIVHAGTIAVLALGTQFNVKAYPGEDRIETTLISGKVQITMAEKPDQRIILDPNEKLTVTNKEPGSTGNDADAGKDLSYQVQEVASLPSVAAVPEVAWLQDKLVFQNEAFGRLAKRMERRYNVRIIFTDSLLGRERLSGVFENETIEKALNLLQMTTPFHYQIGADSVYLNTEP